MLVEALVSNSFIDDYQREEANALVEKTLDFCSFPVEYLLAIRMYIQGYFQRYKTNNFLQFFVQSALEIMDFLLCSCKDDYCKPKDGPTDPRY
jgi:hypothetical protein